MNQEQINNITYSLMRDFNKGVDESHYLSLDLQPNKFKNKDCYIQKASYPFNDFPKFPYIQFKQFDDANVQITKMMNIEKNDSLVECRRYDGLTESHIIGYLKNFFEQYKLMIENSTQVIGE